MVILTVVPVGLYWLFESPVKMVIAGGLAQAMMLPVIGLSTIYLRHKYLPETIAPLRIVTIALWFATALIVVLMGYYLVTELGKLIQ